MVVVPLVATALTSPVTGFTDAIAELAVDHIPPVAPFVKTVADPLQMLSVPFTGSEVPVATTPIGFAAVSLPQ